MDPIPANDSQVISAVFSIAIIVSPRPIDLGPDSAGDAQSQAWATYSG